MVRRQKSHAARAKKLAHLYLTPVEGGGFRFNPGPGLRAKGARPAVLKRNDGFYMSFAEAQSYRDAAIAKANGAEIQLPPSGKDATAREDRSLDALWRRYEAEQRAAIEKNEALPADRRDEDIIKRDTLRFYRSMIKPWLKFAGGDPAAALDAEIIEAEYKNQKAARGHSAAHASYRSLLALLAYGKHIKWLAANEAKGLGLKRSRGRLRLPSPAEVKALVEAGDAIAELDELAGVPGRTIADAIVAALWSGQRQQDILSCDLGLQLVDGFLQFARTHGGDFSQQKTRDRVSDQGGQANVKVLPPLAMRLRGRTAGLLIPGQDGKRWVADTFRHAYAEVRAAAAKTCASVADLQFRDLRDGAVTRLNASGATITQIALWTGHSLKTIEQILEEHYLVTTREEAEIVADNLEAWRKRTGVVW